MLQPYQDMERGMAFTELTEMYDQGLGARFALHKSVRASLCMPEQGH